MIIIAFIGGIYHGALIEIFGSKGWIGFIILALLYGCYKLYIFRDNFMMALRQLETVMFSKPLDKDMWEKDELKNLRIKLKWKKEKKS